MCLCKQSESFISNELIKRANNTYDLTCWTHAQDVILDVKRTLHQALSITNEGICLPTLFMVV